MKSKTYFKNTSVADRLWDLWCIVSILGIWPRFIEPNVLTYRTLRIPIPGLPHDLEGFRIVQFSDLHLHSGMTDYFLGKLASAIQKQSPNLIAFTGDFLCYSQITDKERLGKFLNSLSAPQGCYAILGNHDYDSMVAVNQAGEYDILETSTPTIIKAFQRLFSTTKLARRTTERAKAIGIQAELAEFLKHTPFQLLHNECKHVLYRNSGLNIVGLGEYSLGRCAPDQAFKNYDPAFPGIILAHNPDSISLLETSPGEVVLSGHTHGGQINLPWFWKKFTLLENMKLRHGRFQFGNKTLYVTRGVGSVMTFRWFAPPELVTIILEKKS